MRRTPREWAEFFGALLLLVGIWPLGWLLSEPLSKIMWLIFMTGWDLV